MLSISVYAGITLIILFGVIQQHFGVEELGHWFQKTNSYQTKYYVNLFKERTYSKNYRVVGELSVQESDCDPNYGCNGRPIFLEKAYFPNGGYISFEDCELEINKKAYCIDEEENEWYAELTNVKVE